MDRAIIYLLRRYGGDIHTLRKSVMVKRFKVSTIGLILVGLYVIPSAVSLLYSTAIDDTKGKFILVQLPIALQLALAFRWAEALDGLSWTEGYLLFGLPVVALLYLTGWAIDAMRASRST
jgi:hypothetical protein